VDVFKERYFEYQLKILKDQRFSEFQSYFTVDNLQNEILSDEVKTFLQLVLKLWHQGDEKAKQLLTQLVKASLEVEERFKKE
jgi:hypothetical protein